MFVGEMGLVGLRGLMELDRLGILKGELVMVTLVYNVCYIGIKLCAWKLEDGLSRGKRET